MADILIRGMEMPEMPERMKHEQEEPYVDIRVFASGKAVISTGKRPYYKEFDVVHLPKKHGRLIDADALSKEFEHLASLDWNQKAAPYSWAYAYSEAQASVDDSPTIIEADLEWKMKNCCCFSNTDQAEGGGEDG